MNENFQITPDEVRLIEQHRAQRALDDKVVKLKMRSAHDFALYFLRDLRAEIVAQQIPDLDEMVLHIIDRRIAILGGNVQEAGSANPGPG